MEPVKQSRWDRDGNAQFIIDRVEDVSDLVTIGLQREEQDARAQDLEAGILKKSRRAWNFDCFSPGRTRSKTTEEEFRQLAGAMPQVAWMAKADGWITAT